jgi:hypothetical protein
MNARTLCFVIFSAVFGSNDCWGQPFRNPQTGSMWLYDRNGRTMVGDHLLFKPTTYNRDRSTPTRSNDQRQSFKPISSHEHFAPNLEIHFQLVQVGGAAGARLTHTPPRDSGVSNIRVNGAPVYLESDDVIYKLDSLPIRTAVGVMNHHGQTVVSFIDCRTGNAFTGTMVLPAYTPLPDDVRREPFAANLGMHYQLIEVGDGVFGARLSRTASGGTPAGSLRLELGDMVMRLDGQPIHGTEDVLNHVAATSVDFINICTGKAQIAYVQLPENVPGGSLGAQ